MLRIFVYGTLKPGEVAYDQFFAGQVVEAKDAIAPGLLYDLPVGYPAMTPGEGWVSGCLLIFPKVTLLPSLDAFEDYSPDCPEDSLYTRQSIPIFSPDQSPLGTAWAYLMSPERIAQQQGVFIPSGTWSGRLGEAGHRV